jgi:hypothetical protein
MKVKFCGRTREDLKESSFTPLLKVDSIDLTEKKDLDPSFIPFRILS